MTQTSQLPQLVAGISFLFNELWYCGKQRVAPKIYYGLMVVVGRSRVLPEFV